MKNGKNKIKRISLFAMLLAAAMLLSASCSSVEKADGKTGSGVVSSADAQPQSFAEAHDAFRTTLVREENDDDPIPEPPEGVFDLAHYNSKAGELAAYVSSNPDDGQKHPMIIWVVGGWGNGIDDFPWCYPEWDNDQTGSAFWQAGVLTMYPSFRGGCGNPGYYEALFGEVDDIVSAYEYAASLPYVDSSRIYLGGHSTGATRALLADEYTDKFRAVFCFGAVDEVKYHNNSQFTFDTDKEEEFTMRSPIHWLDNIKTPTFLIEGRDGNSSNLERIERASENGKINCYIIEGADHFSTLAPLTRLAAQKILEDTGAEPNISITQEELESAMKQEPVVPMPVMEPYTVEGLGMTMLRPYLWDVEDVSEGGEASFVLRSRYDGDNVWDMASLYIDAYESDSLEEWRGMLEGEGYEVSDTTVNELPAFEAVGVMENSSGNLFNNLFVMVQKGDVLVSFDFYIHESYGSDADGLFRSIIDSISFAQ